MQTAAADDAWSRSIAARLDKVCVQFEAAWQDGSGPQIEDYLPKEPKAERECLLRELLAVELQWRHERQQVPTPDEYHRRFPSDRQQVEAAFTLAFGSLDRETLGPNVALALTHLCVRCPNCRSKFDVGKGTLLTEISCPSCETRFDLVDDGARDEPRGDADRGRGRKVADRFELIEQLGEGGFGTVWKAHDTELDRMVAVKIPRRGQLTLEETEKFQREARAAAQLDHPNIVSVHDTGADGDTVYIVSDFVDGVSLDEWATGRKITHHEAVQLCSKIARALDCAHSEGIVHRDLKPANVMIDRDGEPKIMDFGLAKRQSVEVTMTMEGQILGTPAYMSPEQARGEGHTADPRADVYSMGVVLFELLTGERPFRGNVQMLLKQVTEDEPPSPRKLDGRVPRDLETICLKCIQKEPNARYGSAQQVADELDRFLAGRPIEARPVGSVERAWRWCRRNPLAATLASAAAMGILFGLLVAAVSYVRISRALLQTQRAQRESEVSLREARQAVDDLFTQVSEDTLLNQPGMQDLRKDLLKRARDYYQRFVQRSGNDPDVRDELAVAHFRVGLITEQVDSLPERAVDSYDEARRIQTRLLASDPTDVDHLRALGNTLNAIGRCRNKQGNLPLALKWYREAVKIREELTKQQPGDIECRRTLANTFMNIGLAQQHSAPEQARDQMKRAQQIRKELLAEDGNDPRVKRDLGKGHYGRARLELNDGDLDAAAEHFSEAYAIFDQLSGTKARDMETSYQLALSLRTLAVMKHEEEDRDAARKHYAEARELMQTLERENPRVHKYRVGLAQIYMNAGELAFESRSPSEAAHSFSLAVELLSPLVKDEAGQARFGDNYIVSSGALAIAQIDDRRYEEAWQTLDALREYSIGGGDRGAVLETVEKIGTYLKELVELQTDDVKLGELHNKTLAAMEALRAARPSGGPTNE